MNKNTIKPTQEEKASTDDLKIGNLLRYKGTEYLATVALINGENHFDCRDEFGSFTPNGEYEPIPLTEEWLDKFQFHQKYTSDPQELNASQAFFIGEFMLHNNAEDNYSGFHFYSYDGVGFLQIKTVHHLQNLYHSLTGLKLKQKGGEQHGESD